MESVCEVCWGEVWGHHCVVVKTVGEHPASLKFLPAHHGGGEKKRGREDVLAFIGRPACTCQRHPLGL